MSNSVDDLLEEVGQLETSTQQMNDDVQELEQQKAKLSNAGSSSSVETNLLALEAAKTAQEASIQSHQAAGASIKLAEQLKAANTELNELSNNWRQATRNTVKDLSSAKNHFAVMMGATLTVNIIVLSAMGYFFYLMNQQNAQHKGEVLDIIQTENNLLSNKLTIKSDELSSLTEALSADIKRLSQLSSSETIHLATPVALPENSTQVAPKIIQPENDNTLDTAEFKTQYLELKNLVEEILANQKTLEISSSTPKTTAQVTQNTDPVQLKKLNDLSWLVRKQGTTLKEIKKTLQKNAFKPASNTLANNKLIHTDLETLKTELKMLRQQQTAIQNRIHALQDNFADFTKKPPEPAPYSYKLKTED